MPPDCTKTTCVPRLLQRVPARQDSEVLGLLQHVLAAQSCSELRLTWLHTAGGRFLFGYQIIAALAVYGMTTAVMDQSPSLMLDAQTRMLLSIGNPLAFL